MNKLAIACSLVGLICGAILITICCLDISQSPLQLLFGIFLVVLNIFLIKVRVETGD
jgi:hypothetical protein